MLLGETKASDVSSAVLMYVRERKLASVRAIVHTFPELSSSTVNEVLDLLVQEHDISEVFGSSCEYPLTGVNRRFVAVSPLKAFLHRLPDYLSGLDAESAYVHVGRRIVSASYVQ